MIFSIAGLEYTLEVDTVQLNSTTTSASFSLTVCPDEQRESFELILTNVTVKKNGIHTLLSDQERSRIQIIVDRARIIIINESGKNYTLPSLLFSLSLHLHLIYCLIWCRKAFIVLYSF